MPAATRDGRRPAESRPCWAIVPNLCYAAGSAEPGQPTSKPPENTPAGTEVPGRQWWNRQDTKLASAILLRGSHPARLQNRQCQIAENRNNPEQPRPRGGEC